MRRVRRDHRPVKWKRPPKKPRDSTDSNWTQIQLPLEPSMDEKLLLFTTAQKAMIERQLNKMTPGQKECMKAAIQNPLILQKILNYPAYPQLLICRLVNKQWLHHSSTSLRKSNSCQIRLWCQFDGIEQSDDSSSDNFQNSPPTDIQNSNSSSDDIPTKFLESRDFYSSHCSQFDLTSSIPLQYAYPTVKTGSSESQQRQYLADGEMPANLETMNNLYAKSQIIPITRLDLEFIGRISDDHSKLESIDLSSLTIFGGHQIKTLKLFQINNFDMTLDLYGFSKFLQGQLPNLDFLEIYGVEWKMNENEVLTFSFPSLQTIQGSDWMNLNIIKRMALNLKCVDPKVVNQKDWNSNINIFDGKNGRKILQLGKSNEVTRIFPVGIKLTAVYSNISILDVTNLYCGADYCWEKHFPPNPSNPPVGELTNVRTIRMSDFCTKMWMYKLWELCPNFKNVEVIANRSNLKEFIQNFLEVWQHLQVIDIQFWVPGRLHGQRIVGFDSVLLGISEEDCEGLRRNLDCEEEEERGGQKVEELRGDRKSVCNMKNLKQLRLRCDSRSETLADALEDNYPFSKVTCHYGFRRLPNLAVTLYFSHHHFSDIRLIAALQGIIPYVNLEHWNCH